MKTDALNRRIRFAPPSPVVGRLHLSEADYQVFAAIDRHGPLPTPYLHAFQSHLRKDYVHFQKRLTELYNGDQDGPYLTRPPRQFDAFEARYQHLVYDLAPRARTMLAELGELTPYSPRRTDPFLHQLMNACVAASIELTAPELSLAYVPRGEILELAGDEARAAKNPMALPVGAGTVIPDDLFGLRFLDGFTRYCAVEIDRNTESIERKNLDYNTIGKKVGNYCAVLDSRSYRSWWNIQNFGVLIVTTNATHAGNILEYIEGHAGKWTERFAVSVVPEFGANWRVPKEILARLLKEDWHTPAGTKNLAVR